MFMAVFVPNGLELKLETMLVKFCSKMKKKNTVLWWRKKDFSDKFYLIFLPPR